MKDALRTSWRVLGWLVLVSLWNAAAVIPIIANVRPAYVTAWIVLLMTGLLLKYAVPAGAGFRQRIGAVLLSPRPAHWKWILPLGVATTMLNASFAVLGEAGDNSAEAAIMAYMSRPMGFVPLVLFLVVFAPLFEELVMRGKVLDLLRSPLGAHGAVLMSAALFAVLHFDQSGGMLGRFCLGVVAGEAVLATGSLLSAIGVHAINNGLGAIGVAVAESLPPSVTERAESPSAAGVVALGLMSAVGVIEAMRRLRTPAAPAAH